VLFSRRTARRHETPYSSDLRLSPNLQVRSNVILSRVGAFLLVSCTLQTRALVHTHGGTVPKRTYIYEYMTSHIIYTCNIYRVYYYNIYM
jgi:hypothetical protein